MREIKFRIWSIRDNVFVKDNRVAICANGYIIRWDYDLEELEYIHDHNNFIKSQYTGLKDKNGKEIFEGDILKFEDGEGFYLEQVIYKGGAFYAVNLQDENLLYEVNDIDFIVGNKFENPELLK